MEIESIEDVEDGGERQITGLHQLPGDGTVDTQLHHPGETRTRDQELSGGTEHRGTPILELDDDERRELNLQEVRKYRYQF